MHLTRAVATTTTARWLPVADMPNADAVRGLCKLIKWISGAKPVAWKNNSGVSMNQQVLKPHDKSAPPTKVYSK